jgi:hypothetical protein
MQPTIVDVAAQRCLNEVCEARVPWKKRGPHLSERQWGTVGEDCRDDRNDLQGRGRHPDEPPWRAHVFFLTRRGDARTR